MCRHGGVARQLVACVVLTRCSRQRPTSPGRCLYFRLPASSRSTLSRSDEVAGKNLTREIIRRAETAVDEEVHRSERMTGQELLDSVAKLFGQKLHAKTEFRGETTYTIAASDLREISKLCRDDLSFDY